MINPSNSNFIKFQDILISDIFFWEMKLKEKNIFTIIFNKEIERLKHYNRSLFSEQFFLNEKKEQILKTQNLLEKENSKLSEEIKTLNNNNNDKNEKKFQVQINNLNNKIEKKNEEIKDFGLKFKSE